jgi:hypothetical protein
VLGVVAFATLWLFGAHRVVQAYIASCDAGAGPGGLLGALFIIFVAWVVFVGLSWFGLRQLRRARGFVPVLVTVGLVVLGMLLATWGYWAWAIPSMAHPVDMAIRCGGDHPAWWPRWIPIP